MPLPHYPGFKNWKKTRRKLKVLNIFKIKKES